MRQGPLWIVEPPLSTGERMSVNDPLLSLRLALPTAAMQRLGLRSGRSPPVADQPGALTAFAVS